MKHEISKHIIGNMLRISGGDVTIWCYEDGFDEHISSLAFHLGKTYANNVDLGILESKKEPGERILLVMVNRFGFSVPMILMFDPKNLDRIDIKSPNNEKSSLTAEQIYVIKVDEKISRLFPIL